MLFIDAYKTVMFILCKKKNGSLLRLREVVLCEKDNINIINNSNVLYIEE